MQGWHLYILGYSASVFGNLASMLIAMLGLLSHSNWYQATVAVIHNIFIVTLININIPGIARISLTIDVREEYEGTIFFHSCKTGISESVPIWTACRYCSASFIAAVLALLYSPLYQYC
jgi:hypothetical protein